MDLARPLAVVSPTVDADVLAHLAGAEAEFTGRQVHQVAGWQEAPTFAALFGSAATGTMRPDSDIDLLVVRPESVDVEGAEWRRQLENLSTRVTAWTGNDTRLLELDEDEVRRGLLGGERVLAGIRDECVVLYGEAAYLRPGPRSRHAGRG